MPNENDYSYVFATEGLAAFEREMVALAVTVEADGYPAQASRIRQAYLTLLEELRGIAAKTAQRGEQLIKRQEATTRVRPDTHGGGGPRMGDHIGQSTALPGVEGSVAFNFLPVLEQNVPWWWTNEEGYSGHIGREIRGFFFDSGFSSPSRPDPSRFREHPLFMTGGQQGAMYGSLGFGDTGAGPRGGKGGKGTIKNPIPDRHFVRDGHLKAAPQWHQDVRRAKARCMSKVRQALIAAPPRPPVAPGRPRPPRPGRPPGRRP